MTLRLNSLNDLQEFASADVLEMNGLGEPKAPPAPMQPPQGKQSHLEAKFASLWARLELPELEQEVRFHPVRKWRLDFAHKESFIAIEVEGVAYRGKSRHRTVGGFEEDCLKYFEAAKLGWTVLRLSPKLITEENLISIGEMIEQR